MKSYIKRIAGKAREASFKLAQLDSRLKNEIIFTMTESLLENEDFILKENKKDLIAADKNKLSRSLVDRLTLNKKRIAEMSRSLREIAALPDPVNRLISDWKRPNGLFIQKVRVPIGVVFVIYEARPNVTSDSIGLMIKSSNFGILRGGKDALNSNQALGKIFKKVAKTKGLDFEPFFIIERPEHRIVNLLLKEDTAIDLVIPRGGEGLIRKVVENSRIPVIKHYKGVCHIFVDKNAGIAAALKVCINAKVQRPSVCNAVETILVHQAIAKIFLPRLKREFDRYGVKIIVDSRGAKIIKGAGRAKKSDWSKEYLGLTVSLKVVDGIEEAIRHINFYGSHHTDSILTNDKKNAQRFVKEVDSACCFVNISTRFSDGYQFGLGAEIGISTDKLHARGPMGIEDLTTYKYVVYGNGQVRK